MASNKKRKTKNALHLPFQKRPRYAVHRQVTEPALAGGRLSSPSRICRYSGKFQKNPVKASANYVPAKEVGSLHCDCWFEPVSDVTNAAGKRISI
jgi:hypothetical protein